MKRQTFVLLQTKPFRYFLKLFMKDKEQKIFHKMITFTTEHKVSEKERTKNARLKAAEYSTSDEAEIKALYQDTGYGKLFVNKDDPEGKRKQERFDVTPLDAKKMALRNLFAAINLPFDGNKPVEVLTEEYRIHVIAKTGVQIQTGEAKTIPLDVRDVQKTMEEQAEAARKLYEEKYGEPIPGEFTNNLAFLSSLADSNFDAKAFIASNQTKDDDSEGGAPEEKDDLPDDAATLGEMYFNAFGKNVPNPKKNDTAWIKLKLKENKG